MKCPELILIGLLFLLLASCKEPCKGGCGPHQICKDDQCVCAPYYEGADCNTLIKSKVLGTYSGTFYTPNDTTPKLFKFYNDSANLPSSIWLEEPYGFCTFQTSTDFDFLGGKGKDTAQYIYLGNGLVAADGKSLIFRYRLVKTGTPNMPGDTLFPYLFIGTR